MPAVGDFQYFDFAGGSNIGVQVQQQMAGDAVVGGGGPGYNGLLLPHFNVLLQVQFYPDARFNTPCCVVLRC